MKRNIIQILISLAVALVVISCDTVDGIMPEFQVKDKTVLVYMVGNNNLSSDAYNNLKNIKKGYIPQEDNLLVYYHTPSQSPVLLQILKDETGAVVQDTVYRFPPRNSSTPESLTSAMKVTQTMFPAREYGLFLWSHGTGWLPEGQTTKSFGYEEKLEIEIQDLVRAFPYKLSFVVFDACLMGCIEVAYQMKDSVDYVIASPAEVLANGFPYANLMQHIFKTPADLESVAREYYDYYNSYSGDMRSATVSLVDTKALEDVAKAARPLFEKYRENIKNLDYTDVQRYYRGNMHWFFDFADYMVKLAGEQEAQPVLKALDRAVLYKATTPYFLEIPIDKERYSGLSSYIPIDTTDVELISYYKTLEWNKAVGMIE